MAGNYVSKEKNNIHIVIDLVGLRKINIFK